MKNYVTQLIRIDGMSGIFYTVPSRKTSSIVIYGVGAPLVPDNGSLPDAKYILDFDVDLFVPDYIGYSRSKGKFTPLNCIKTFLALFERFTKGCIATNKYEDIRLKLKYKEVIFIGRSFGGAYIPLLPRYNNKIKNLCLIYPIADPLTWVPHSGCPPAEETYKDFMNSMIHDGYKNLYRGITSRLWQNHFQNKDKLSPMENIKLLRNTKLFIAHGRKDVRINFSHSVKYYKKIIQRFPMNKNQFRLKIYSNGDHSSKTSNRAVRDYLTWLEIPKH